MPIPALDSFLPDFTPFTRALVDAYHAGGLNSWDAAADRVLLYFSPECLLAFDAVIPGWLDMASYANQQTLIHVSLAFAALAMLPEYADAPPDQQRMAEWVVAFHDVTKQPRRGSHDWTHGFRSAGVAGRALPALGFAARDDLAALDAWAEMTHAAQTPHPTEDTLMQDNRHLPAILDGLHTLFGQVSPASQIVKGVLFHMSIDAVADYPTAAPLRDDEVRSYIDAPTLQLLKMMMLVDCDAWALFDPPLKARDRGLVLAEFDRLSALY
ncbi:MAG: hypothetical protein JNL42_11470 [Anaerolineae bacterium]|nr:hypothetical protein [Anaerolineae bacterium]